MALNDQHGELRYVAEAVDGLTPDRIYEKRWAAILLEKVFGRIREKYASDDKERLFEALKPYVLGETLVDGYDEMGARLGVSAGALRVAMHRLRETYRDVLRDEVARTVASPTDVDEELRQLISALRS